MRFIYSAAMFYYFWFHIIHIIRLNEMLVFPHRGKLRTIFSQILNFFSCFSFLRIQLSGQCVSQELVFFFSIFCSALFLCSHSSCYLLLFSFFKRDFDRQHTHTECASGVIRFGDAAIGCARETRWSFGTNNIL